VSAIGERTLTRLQFGAMRRLWKAFALWTGFDGTILPRRYRLLAAAISLAILAPAFFVVIAQGRDAPMRWWYGYFAAVLVTGAMGDVIARYVWRRRT